MRGETEGRTGLPIVAVLPFSSLGLEEQHVLLADGLHEDICAALTRFRSLQVISPHSVAAVAALDDAEIGARLGASHILRGRLRRTGDSLRMTATLVACPGCLHLWDERLEVPLGDLHRMQDGLVARVAASLHVRFEEAALAAARRRFPAELAVHELTLRGLAMLRQGTLEADEAARALFEQAIALDPHYARAYAGMALSWFNEWSCQFWDRFEEASRQAYHYAHRALELDDRDGMIHLVIAKVQLFREAHEKAAWYLDRALALCPNDADLLIQASVLEVYLGRPEAGVEHIVRAIRLNPFHPNEYHAVAAFVHLFAGDIEGAIARRELSDAIPFVDAPAYCAVAYAHAGRIAEARAELARFHEQYRLKIAFGGDYAPGAPLAWLFDANPFRRPEDVTLIRDGFSRLDEPEVAAPPPAAPADRAALLARAGEGWIVEFAGRRAILPDLKGLRDIRRLLERPGEETHCLDLAERSETAYGADAALDERARTALKARIRDLGEELADAEDMNDTGRAEKARDEMERLVETLSQALGLGGRGRRIGDLAERARSTVTWRIRYALRRIETVHPAFGAHLAQTLRTGAFCIYQPWERIGWRFEQAETEALP